METFADVLHNLIDHVFTGDLADKAHGIIDRASGTRTPEPAPDPAPTAAAPEPAQPPADPPVDPAQAPDPTPAPDPAQ